jgi:hypothetical protein
MVKKGNNKLNLGEKMIIKRKNFLIAVSVFVGCSSSTPTVVRNGGTETTQVGGVTTASMRHQSCYDNGEYLVCSTSDGGQTSFKKDSCFGKGYAGMSSNGNINGKVLPSRCENASGVLVKTYPYLRAIANFFKNK